MPVRKSAVDSRRRRTSSRRTPTPRRPSSSCPRPGRRTTRACCCPAVAPASARASTRSPGARTSPRSSRASTPRASRSSTAQIKSQAQRLTHCATRSYAVRRAPHGAAGRHSGPDQNDPRGRHGNRVLRRGDSSVLQGRRPAVDDITLDIADGEFLVLVGPSGCGKSTTLRMLAGLEPIDGGRILIDGHDQKGVRPRDRDMAMVFQSYALYPNMTAAENMAFALDQREGARSPR